MIRTKNKFILKKTYFSCILLVILLYTAIKTQTKAQFHIGIRQEVGLSRTNLVPSVKQNFIPATSSGIVMMLFPYTNAGIQLEINYTNKGYQLVSDTSEASYQQKLSYFEVPLLTHIYIGKRKNRIAFTVGPQFAYRLQTKTKGNIDEAIIPAGHFMNTELTETTFDMAITGGIALSRKFIFGTLQLDLRYSHSLTNVFNFEVQEYSSWIQNQMFGVALSYIFTIGEKKEDHKPIKTKLEKR